MNQLRSIGKWVSLGIVSLIGLLVIVALLRVSILPGLYTLIASWLYPPATYEWAMNELGLESSGATLVTAIYGALNTLLAPSCLAYLLFGRKKVYGVAGILANPMLTFALVHTLGNNVCFDAEGKPLCQACEAADGQIIVVHSQRKVDPVSGRKCRLYTQEMIQEVEKSQGQTRVGISPAGNAWWQEWKGFLQSPQSSSETLTGGNVSDSCRTIGRDMRCTSSPKMNRLPEGILRKAEQGYRVTLVLEPERLKTHQSGWQRLPACNVGFTVEETVEGDADIDLYRPGKEPKTIRWRQFEAEGRNLTLTNPAETSINLRSNRGEPATLKVWCRG